MKNKLPFKDWCKWNMKEMSAEYFVLRHNISPDKFKNKYWKKGLQEFWIKITQKKK